MSVYDGLSPDVTGRAMQIASSMPDEFPEGFAVFLAEQELDD